MTFTECQTRSPQETQAFAAGLVRQMPPGTIVCLAGDLGAGKTCLAKGLARGLGITRSVGSPTFTLINEYPGARPFAHMDLYRIANDTEAFGLGLEEYLFDYDGITAIEWPERAGALIPQTAWRIEIQADEQEPDVRRIRVTRP